MKQENSEPPANRHESESVRPWVVVVSYLLFFALFGWVITQKRAILASLSWDNAGGFLLVLLLALATTVVRGLLNQVSFSLQHRITIPVGVKLAVVNTLGNYLPLSGGLVAKGILLARHYGIGYTFYAGVSMYAFLLSIAANGLLGMVGSLATNQSILLVCGFALVLLSGLFAFIPIPLWIRRLGKGMGERLEYARSHFACLLPRMSGLVLMLFLLAALRLQCAFAVLEVEVSLFVSMLINSVSVFSRLTGFVPGGIGIREFLVALMGHLAGLDFQMTILVVGLDRMGELVINFLLAGLLFRRVRFMDSSNSSGRGERAG